MEVYVETYGCRMNICDSEIIIRILSQCNYHYTKSLEEADLVILNCCSVREVGHKKVYQRIGELETILDNDVIICLAGCMATQINESIFKKYSRLQIVIPPAAYKKLPEALTLIRSGKAQNLYLTGEKKGEVYNDIIPFRVLEDQVTAAITIMKGCDQYCSYCIEPYTRGERTNRSYDSIKKEVIEARRDGYKEITLFGHIVDLWEGCKQDAKISFPQLLDDIAWLCPEQRIKYISSHPLTYSDSILEVVRNHHNIMRIVHLPLQSGSDFVLQRMNRHYTSSRFLERIEAIRKHVPDMQIITDVMVGFPGESEQDFQMTLDFLRLLRCADANVFAFSMRKGTIAYQRYEDDVPEEVKQERLEHVKSLVREIRTNQIQQLLGSVQTVLAEHQHGEWWYGRDAYHRTIAFLPPKGIKTGMELTMQISQIKDNQIIGVVL